MTVNETDRNANVTKKLLSVCCRTVVVKTVEFSVPVRLSAVRREVAESAVRKCYKRSAREK